jgi:eukaryotic-like serine/threonine-protein kinase
VQYAHRRLVVHRDLKAANILVTSDGEVKLLDFGIAKLLEEDAACTPGDLTQAGLGFMTPVCASPEQLRGEPVSTASDVYPVGVLLYLLLTGRHPHALPGQPPHELARAVLEDPPAPPSAVAVAGVRRQLRGDLDTIRRPPRGDPGGGAAREPDPRAQRARRIGKPPPRTDSTLSRPAAARG